MHKVITFGIPSYNAAADMDRCITSILEGSAYAPDVEIIIVDDGSKDETPAKADEWVARYPGIIRAVHQLGGGVVICGYRLLDMTVSELAENLSGQATLLVIAKAALLNGK